MWVNEFLLLQLGQAEVLGALDLSEAVLLGQTLSTSAPEFEEQNRRTDSAQLHVKGAPMSHSVEG